MLNHQKQNRFFYLIMASFLGIIFVLSVLIGLPIDRAEAAPPAAPTPAANVNMSSVLPKVTTFLDETAITADATYCKPLAAHEVVDLEYVIDQATATNTITLTMKYTNDSTDSNYTDGAAVVSGNSSDASALQQFPVFGAYTCIAATVANTNPVTLTLTGVGK
jgi:hypothetical protein